MTRRTLMPTSHRRPADANVRRYCVEPRRATPSSAAQPTGEFDIGAIDIRGNRCALRDWDVRDVPGYTYWQAPQHTWHDTNGPYFGRPTAADARAQSDRLERYVTADRSLRPSPRESLAIVTPADRMVGSVTWYWESQVTRWRRMGIVLYDPAARGMGIGVEALSLWTTYLFDHTVDRRLDFATYSGNEPMCAVGRRLGFTEEGRFRKARPWQGVDYDGMVFGVLREEWESRPDT